MSDETTRWMIEAYNQEATATMFFAGMFRSPPRNFYNSEEIEMDIRRGTEKVSIVVQDISQGYRYVSTDIATNKSFIAPVHKDAAALNSFQLLKRGLGDDPFADFSFRTNATIAAFDNIRNIEENIRRSMEWQASQVAQTGAAILTDSAGTALFSINYSPKSSHLPTSGTAWGTPGATIPILWRSRMNPNSVSSMF